MARGGAGPAQSGGGPTDQPSRTSLADSFRAEPELVVVVKPEVGLRVRDVTITSVTGEDVSSLSRLMQSQGASLYPLFGVSEDRLRSEATALATRIGEQLPNLAIYYGVDAPQGKLDDIADLLRQQAIVEAAYVKPSAELPRLLNLMVPASEEAPAVTPDFSPRQGYLDAAPGGVDAKSAWTIPGGSGSGVGIIDIEGAWRFSHEDLLSNQGGVIGGAPDDDLDSRNHGTAVVGVFGGDRNAFGITGICPDANVRAVAICGRPNCRRPSSAQAIRQAANALNPGDIILIEIHRPGPRFNFRNREDQRGYIATEWWPDDFDAILYATKRGILVVEAAGNGAENLDDPIYDMRPWQFPASWTNPFNRANRDSGGIVVGAGNPPAGTHGRIAHPDSKEPYVDRARCFFSNFGELVDAQGWGWEVTTCGYGDLQGGSMSEDLWYTDKFGGTSSASPIVVGALGCVQGILRARSLPLLTPAQARECLRSTGSPQQATAGRPASERIGNRPNIRQLLSSLGSVTN